MGTVGDFVRTTVEVAPGVELPDGNTTQSGRPKGTTVSPARPAAKKPEALPKVVPVLVPKGFSAPKMVVFKTTTQKIEEAKVWQRQLREAMTGTETEVGIAPAIRQNVLALRELLAYSREEREVVKDDIASIRATLVETANYPIEPVDYRTPARLAYLDALVREWPESHIHTDYSIRGLCKELVGLGFLRYVEKTEQNVGVRIAGSMYALAEGYGRRPEARESFKELSKLWQEFLHRQRQEFQADMEEATRLVGNQRVNQDQAKSGQEGRGVWDVADHTFVDRLSGRQKTYYGGKAVFEVKDGQVGILMGFGSLKTVVQTVEGVAISVSQIGTERLELGYREEDQSLFGKQRLLHSLAGRAMKAWKDGASLREQRAEEFREKKTTAEKYVEELQREATLTPETFQQEGTVGTLACTGWQGKFVTGKERKWVMVSPHFLLEKRADGKVRVIRYAVENERFFRRYVDFRSLAECGQLKVLVNAAGVSMLRAGRTGAETTESVDEGAIE